MTSSQSGVITRTGWDVTVPRTGRQYFKWDLKIPKLEDRFEFDGGNPAPTKDGISYMDTGIDK